jgi:hypothetical protein
MTANQLSSISAIVLSLVFSYIPRVKNSFDKLEGVYKRLVMLVLLALVTGISFGLSCWSIFAGIVAIQCSQAGAIGLLSAFVQAVIANQATFLISPQTKPSPVATSLHEVKGKQSNQ